MKRLFDKARKLIWPGDDPEQDRSTGLVVFGAIEILMGIAAFSLAMILMELVSSTGLGGVKAAHYRLFMGYLLLMTGWYCTLGMGSIMALRWARVLMLVGSWVAVFFGTLALALILYLAPWVYHLLADPAIFSPQATLALLYTGLVALITLQLVFPLAAVSFYRLRGVRATCEWRNPKPCWTDRFPLPLIVLGFLSALGVANVFLGAATNYVVFVFGRIWTGWSGFAVTAAVAAACGYVGWGAFTRKKQAWWTAYGIILVTSSSMMITFSGLDMEEAYRMMGYSGSLISALEGFQLLSPAPLTFVTCVWSIMACAYLIWVRDCFQPGRETVEVKSDQ
jgi:hypothetical protein